MQKLPSTILMNLPLNLNSEEPPAAAGDFFYYIKVSILRCFALS